VALRSTNAGLTIPASVTIPAGASNASVSFTSTSTMTGWAIISASLGTVTKSVTITASAAARTTGSTPASSVLRLRCDQKQISAGGKAICEVLYNPAEDADAIDLTVSTDSAHLKAPASVRGRGTRNTLHFEITADEDGPLENAVIEVQSTSSHARESLLIIPSGLPHLRVPRSLIAGPGVPVRFAAAAVDDQGAPVPVSANSTPDGAVFNTASGTFEWTPTDRDLGAVDVSFTAKSALGVTTKSVHIQVGSSRPVLSGLRNGVGRGAPAACSPGALATLTGTSFGNDSSDPARVLVNGSEASVVRAFAEQVDFVCPMLSAGTPMGIAVQVGNQVSDEIRTVMQQTSPGLLSVDGSGSGQGVVTHARGLSALPRFEREGMPAVAGEPITLFATGISCDDTSGNSKPLVYLGHDYQPITLLRPSVLPGVCEVHTIVPNGVSGTQVHVAIEAIREDGTSVKSNTILIAIE
jgi:uncharacterized protein (TIGR03437 family)